MTPALAAELATLSDRGWGKVSLIEPVVPTQWPAGSPALPLLHTLELHESLDDALTAQLVQCLGSVGCLRVPSIAVQSGLPQGAAAPWRGIKVNPFACMPLGSWLCQAKVLGKETSWELESLDLSLTPEQVGMSPETWCNAVNACVLAHMLSDLCSYMWSVMQRHICELQAFMLSYPCVICHLCRSTTATPPS